MLFIKKRLTGATWRSFVLLLAGMTMATSHALPNTIELKVSVVDEISRIPAVGSSVSASLTTVTGRVVSSDFQTTSDDGVARLILHLSQARGPGVLKVMASPPEDVGAVLPFTLGRRLYIKPLPKMIPASYELSLSCGGTG